MSEEFGNITSTGVGGGGDDSSFGEISKRAKFCGITLNIKFPVVAGENPPGKFSGVFYPTGEMKITEDGDEWGSKGQGGRDQELELEVLGCEYKDCPPIGPNISKTGICSLEVNTSKTTLDQTPGAKSNVEVDTEAWFVCCVCGEGGDPPEETCDECCTEDNFTEEGGGDCCFLGAWRTCIASALFSNKKNRTPNYSRYFQIGPPGKENQDLKQEMESQFFSDLIKDGSNSYRNTTCGYGSDDRG